MTNSKQASRLNDAILSLLSSPENRISDGRSIYQVTQQSSQSRGDESALHTWVLSMIHLNFESSPEGLKDEHCEQESIICKAILDIDPNKVLKDGPDNHFTQFAPLPTISGIAPRIHATLYNDLLTLHNTDETIYITLLESGQY